MLDLIKLSWRNIWRNKRRTLITAASIFLAVALSTLMSSVQKGAWDKMIDNVVNFHFGYAQIHKNGFWEEQTINESFQLSEQVINVGKGEKNLKTIVPRIESFALAAYGNTTKGVLVVGTDPEKENQMTDLRSRLVEGDYFQANESEVMVASGVAERMKLAVGDTLVLLSTGYHGVNAAGKYPIKGIVKFGSPDLNKQMVYLPLKAAQYFYGAEGMVTTLALDIDDRNRVGPIVQKIKNEISTEEYEVMEWQELMPELVEARAVDTAGAYIVLLLLYIIIAFGIFGTILMMTKEREYEFGVLIGIGMSRMKLFFSVWLEIIFLGLIGAGIGILISLPLVYYFNVNPLNFTDLAEGSNELYEKFGFEPIFPAAFDFNIFFTQALIVFLVTSVLALYPFFKIRSIEPVQAMRK